MAYRYQRLFPTAIILPNSQTPIFVDRKERRGRALLLGRAAGQRGLKVLWHRAISYLAPDVVLDVGANYGEFVFGERYPATCRIFALEANPALIPFLQKSMQGHPDRERIQVLCALAAEESDIQRTFYIDKDWTGRSSAVPRSDTNTMATKVCTVAIDDVLANLSLVNRTLVFKIDVEGFEPAVLSGMTRVVGEAKLAMGLVEFNSRLIEQSGVSPHEFVDRLSSHFHLIALPHKRKAVRLVSGTFDELRQIDDRAEVAMDLLAYTRNDAPLYDGLITQVLGQASAT